MQARREAQQPRAAGEVRETGLHSLFPPAGGTVAPVSQGADRMTDWLQFLWRHFGPSWTTKPFLSGGFA